MWKNFRPLIQTGSLWPEHYEIFFSQTQVTLAIPWIEWSGPGNGSPCGVLKSFQSSLLSIAVKVLPYVSTECCLLLLTYPNWSLMSCKSFFEMDRASCICLLLPVVSVVLLTWCGWWGGELGSVHHICDATLPRHGTLPPEPGLAVAVWCNCSAGVELLMVFS